MHSKSGILQLQLYENVIKLQYVHTVIYERHMCGEKILRNLRKWEKYVCYVKLKKTKRKKYITYYTLILICENAKRTLLIRKL